MTVSASGNGSLLVIQRAIIVNFGLALANSGLNVAGGGALNAALPDPAAAQQLLLMLLGSGGAAPGAALTGGGGGGGPITIGTGDADAIGNDTKTGIHQRSTARSPATRPRRRSRTRGSATSASAIANSGGNGAAARARAASTPPRSRPRAARCGRSSPGSPGSATRSRGSTRASSSAANLLQLHGDVSGTESLLGITEPGTEVDADDASVVIRQVTAVLNIGHRPRRLGPQHRGLGHRGDGTTTRSAGPARPWPPPTITTGDATAVGSHFAATVCQAIGDARGLRPRDADPPDPPNAARAPEPPVVVPEVHEPEAPPVRQRAGHRRSASRPPDPCPRPCPFTGSPIGAELAAGSGLLIAGMLMARRRRTGASR